MSDLHRFKKQRARTNINFTKGQIILISAVLAELFVRMLVRLLKVMLSVSLEAPITKTESYTTGRGETFVVKTFIRCESVQQMQINYWQLCYFEKLGNEFGKTILIRRNCINLNLLKPNDIYIYIVLQC